MSLRCNAFMTVMETAQPQCSVLDCNGLVTPQQKSNESKHRQEEDWHVAFIVRPHPLSGQLVQADGITASDRRARQEPSAPGLVGGRRSGPSATVWSFAWIPRTEPVCFAGPGGRAFKRPPPRHLERIPTQDRGLCRISLTSLLLRHGARRPDADSQ